MGNKSVFVRLVYNMSSGAGKKTLDVLGERHRHRIAVESKLRRKDTGKKQRKGLRGIGKERGLSTDCPGRGAGMESTVMERIGLVGGGYRRYPE